MDAHFALFNFNAHVGWRRGTPTWLWSNTETKATQFTGFAKILAHFFFVRYCRLMGWIQSKVPDLPINNFTNDWNDGRAIGALVDGVAPGNRCTPKRFNTTILTQHVV